MSTDLISVVMPVYNSEKYLAKAIQSIIDQTWENFELIIINDNSSDDSLKVMQSFKDIRIRIIDNEKNLGICGSLNLGISLARGRYIARMDHDDISEPDRLETTVKYMSQHGLAIAGTWVRLINEKGRFKNLVTEPVTSKACVRMLKYATCFFHPTVVFDTEKVPRTKIVYDKSYQGAEDYYLWRKLASQYRVGNVPRFLLRYRVLSTSMTRVMDDTKRIQLLARIWAAEEENGPTVYKLYYKIGRLSVAETKQALVFSLGFLRTFLAFVYARRFMESMIYLYAYLRII